MTFGRAGLSPTSHRVVRLDLAAHVDSGWWGADRLATRRSSCASMRAEQVHATPAATITDRLMVRCVRPSVAHWQGDLLPSANMSFLPTSRPADIPARRPILLVPSRHRITLARGPCSSWLSLIPCSVLTSTPV